MPFDELRDDDMTKSRTSDDSAKNDKKKKSILPSIFSRKGKNKRGSDGEIFPRAEIVFDLESRYITRTNLLEAYPTVRKSLSGRHTSSRIEGLNLSILEKPRRKSGGRVEEYRVFVGTWNVGGRSPNNGLNLEDFLQVEGSADIYVLGFQEIVPLNAGNVLVIEDNEPATKWLALISHALNKPSDKQDDSSETWNGAKLGKDCKSSSSHLFQKPSSLKAIGKNCRVDGTLVKTCNCRPETASGIRRRARKLREFIDSTDSGSDDEYYCHPMSHVVSPEARRDANYSLVASKQMVGIFLSVWVRSELVPDVGHLRVATVGRGIMGCLGNKGCIAMSMSLHRTSFCFVCSHLTSGEKEGDELKRNADVSEILKSTQFPRVCKIPGSRIPEKILEHDRILWLGDLNYRIALSYNEATTLLEYNDWDSLLGRDQLKMEREAGRVFDGWKEGKIYFAPTYKYSYNSDAYAGETTKSKKKRRTPAWCDRILWYGEGIEQLQYFRGESRFSDHRPVCAVFLAQVEASSHGRCRKGYSSVYSRIPRDEMMLPQRHSFYEL
ncbi:type I inositol polyphosphate 5-phosphatase 5-like [Musa acuminata AAA Group]|uniref:type I inositol polyphosphate 5-phosphatase 5-like n=1 Tax=Musa acuminata AAA Group TaxID=214697 RepID=UPI0031DF12A6